MRALMTATVPSMIGQFNMNNIKLLIELGYDVDVACNFEDHSVWSKEKIEQLKDDLDALNVNTYHIDFERSMFKVGNHIKSYKQIKKLMNEREYDLIHTHTPISSLITRIAFKNSRIFNKCKMIYTAHGFHFFKGNNPLKNFLFRNIERYGARYTDTLITINKEDYAAAKKFKLRKNGTVEYVPGVGIDIDKINSIKEDRNKLIKELGIPKDSILLISVGELSKRKNHEVIIKSLKNLPSEVHYLICGKGSLGDHLINLTRQENLLSRVHFLGFRSNVIEIVKSCDIFVFPSLQEGLPVALMEALACKKPCVASNIRGNVDLVNKINGLLVNSFDEDDWVKSIKAEISLLNKKKINNEQMNFFKIDKINEQMKNIYS